MIDKDKMFSLFEDPNKKVDGKELITMGQSLLDEPFTKIGMFTKLIVNHNVFHQKLEKFLKAEKPNYDVDDARRASEFTVFNRAWHYIKGIDLKDRNHLEAIMDFKAKPFMQSLNEALAYFQRPDVEQYERCAKLLEIKNFKRDIENPVPM
tara:strand:+ start:1570 stop:2022 length:453 start_codon:yes stop_codon:yes gene_type:complete